MAVEITTALGGGINGTLDPPIRYCGHHRRRMAFRLAGSIPTGAECWLMSSAALRLVLLLIYGQVGRRRLSLRWWRWGSFGWCSLSHEREPRLASRPPVGRRSARVVAAPRSSSPPQAGMTTLLIGCLSASWMSSTVPTSCTRRRSAPPDVALTLAGKHGRCRGGMTLRSDRGR
jgi:hypothetical protein